jgi:hypothetical protein
VTVLRALNTGIAETRPRHSIDRLVRIIVD